MEKLLCRPAFSAVHPVAVLTGVGEREVFEDRREVIAVDVDLSARWQRGRRDGDDALVPRTWDDVVHGLRERELGEDHRAALTSEGERRVGLIYAEVAHLREGLRGQLCRQTAVASLLGGIAGEEGNHGRDAAVGGAGGAGGLSFFATWRR